MRQRQQGIACDGAELRRDGAQTRHILGAQQAEQFGFESLGSRVGPNDGAHHADMAQVQAHGIEARQRQRGQRELLNFRIRFETGVTINFGTDLQWLAGGVQPDRAGMQDAACVAQSRHRITIQQMRIDPRDLGRHVGPQANGSARQLVDQLEGTQVEILSRSGQQ